MSQGAAEPAESDVAPEPGNAAAEPISPELALIDPELASVARARLAVPAAARRPATPVPRHFAATAPDPAELPPRRRRRGRRIAAVALVLLGIAAGVLFVPTDRVLRAVHLDEDVSVPARTAPAGGDQGQAQEARPAALDRRGTAQPAAFGWVAVPGASYYLVRFFRGGREIYEARPAGPHLVLPLHWNFRGRELRLEPGRYRWSVRPGYGSREGGRYGKPIVDAAWVFPARSGAR